jgi:hypothetical protein
MSQVGPGGWEDPVEWPTSRLWQVSASPNAPRGRAGTGWVRRLVSRMGTFMAMAGAVGLVGMALVGAVEVGASSTSLPTNGTIYFTCFLNQGSQGSSCQTGSDVQKATYDYQGGVLTVGAPQAVANTRGADGIQFLANGDLVVAGQQSGGVTEINPANASVVARVTTTLSSVDHISLEPQGAYLTAGGYGGGGLDLIPVSNGVIQKGISCQLQQPAGTAISSNNVVMDTVAWTPSGQAYYTQSNPSDLYGGYGTFGAISITYTAGTTPSCTAALTPILTGFPAAHGMAYDPYSQDLMLFGSQMVAQIAVSGSAATLTSEVTFGGEACTTGLASCLKYTGSSGSISQDMFDQGAVDGLGHLFVSNNNGNLAFVDYSQSPSRLIAGTSTAPSYVYDQFETTAMDDVAPLVGAGGPLEVNTQALPSSATVGQPLQDSVQVLNAQAGGTVQFELFGPGDSGCTVSSGEPVYASPAISYNQVTVQSPVFSPTAPEATGTYEWLVTYSNSAAGQSQNSGCGKEPVVVSGPQLATTPSPKTATVGQLLKDTATVTGLPVGQAASVSFALYQGGSCTGQPVFRSGGSVVAGTATSGSYTVNSAGPYQWTATLTYGNLGATVQSGCGSEPVTVMAAPTLSTIPQGSQVSSSESGWAAPFDATVADQATITGGYNLTGQMVTFKLFDNASCSGSPVLTSQGQISSAGIAASASYVVNQAGTWEWTASYGGDQYNKAASSACGAEPVQVAQAVPTITTITAPGASVVVGSQIRDQANVSNASNGQPNSASGSVTFNLYGAQDASCANPPVATSLGGLSVGQPSSVAYSQPYTVTQVGTYHWMDKYNGDSNDQGATSPCSAEPVQVTQATVQMTTNPLPGPSVAVGTSISDEAEVTGGYLPAAGGATVTFNLYSNSSCTGSPVLTSTGQLNAGGSATSLSYQPQLAGVTYYWQDTYNGNSDNKALTGACGEPVVVQQVTPQITTSQVTPIVSANGNVVSDSAQLGGFFPDPRGQGDGQLIFGLFADQGCLVSESGPGLIATATAPVAYDSATGQYGATVNQTLSAPLPPGTYYWQVSFLGSANDAQVTSTCGEPLVVEPNTEEPLTTQQTPATAAVGTPISDTATISRLAENPAQVPTTDTMTFQVVSSCPATPNTAPAAGTVLFNLGSFPVTITAQGTGYVGTAATNPPSLPVPSAAGTYYWNVSFSGDAYNAPVSNQCGEPVVLGPTTATITTTPSPGGAVGTTLTDTASLSGLFDPASSDRVDFSLFSDSSCSAGALVQDLGSVSLGSPSNGVWTVQSPGGAKPSVAQTYYWGVTFTPAEDANNPGTTVCGEPVTLTSAGGVLGASTGSTPTTGAGLLVPGILASLLLLLGGFVLSLGLRLRRRATV